MNRMNPVSEYELRWLMGLESNANSESKGWWMMNKAINALVVAVTMALVGAGCAGMGGRAEDDCCTFFDNDGQLTAECVFTRLDGPRQLDGPQNAPAEGFEALDDTQRLSDRYAYDFERLPDQVQDDLRQACRGSICGDFGCLCLKGAALAGDELTCIYSECAPEQKMPSDAFVQSNPTQRAHLDPSELN